MIDRAVITSVETILSKKVLAATPVSGGDINKTYCLQTVDEKFFIKVNSASLFPNMFEREAEGLTAIAETCAIKTPNGIACGESGGHSYFLMEWIDAVKPDTAGFARLGEGLAKLHGNTSLYFGFEEDNYIGSLPQRNGLFKSWSDFYIMERLYPLVKMAVDSGKFSKADEQHFEQLYSKLPGLFEPERPSLLHGDLWSGNFLINKNQQPYLIDSAVYYGHREMDIALTTLFGGFGKPFYDAYQHHFPLMEGFEQRIKLWNLYPLLVHVNLFGGGYVQQLRNYLRTYL